MMMAMTSWSGVAYAASAGLMAGLMQESATTTPMSQGEVDAAVDAAIREAGGLVKNGDNVLIDVTDLFDIEPGLTLTADEFTATSSDTGVVRVSISDNPHVVLTPRRAGMARITVRHPGSGARVRFEVEVLLATPAMPLVGSGLLALFLFAVGAYRRYRSA